MMTEAELNERTKQRVAGRTLAGELLKLIAEESAGQPPEGMTCLWEEIYAEAIKHYTPPMAWPMAWPIAMADSHHKMTDGQSRNFERRPVPFGQYAQRTVGNVMADPDGRNYLVWLSEQTFIDDLRDYLANPTIAQELS